MLQFAHLTNVCVLALPQDELTLVAAKLTRSTHWGVMISDSQLYISDGDQQIALPLECWHGELPATL